MYYENTFTPEFEALELVDGYLQYSVGNQDEVIIVRSPAEIKPGVWAHATATRSVSQYC